MKKTVKKPLTLRRETVKALTTEEIYAVRVGGGAPQDKCTAGFSGCSSDWAFKCSHAN